MIKWIEQKFEFESFETSWTTEILAGVSLFMSLSYIFIVNPSILSQTGIPAGAVFFATVVASGLATFAMGAFSKLPFALAPGLESNSFFAFVVVASLGFNWQQALGLVFWSGFLCLFMTIIPARKKIIDAIPEGLKIGIATTVGVFVVVVGLVVADLLQFKNGLPHSVGNLGSPKTLILTTGFFVALFLGLKRFKFTGGMLVSIIVCSILARMLGINTTTPNITSSDFFSAVGKLDLFGVFKDPRAWTVLLVFFMIDFYGSIGKFIGLTRQTNLQSNGKVKNMEKALYVDGCGTMLGATLGTSTVITYVESAVAIGQGGRTGVVAIVCGLLMLASLVFLPLVGLVPVVAASGVLLYVGWLLLPKGEIASVFIGNSKTESSLDKFDLLIILIMAATAVITFSLDKSLLLGFGAYSLKQIFKSHSLNRYLGLSTALLFVAMAFQYFGF
ncbi:MAG: NCS2 family permease [Hellea sp.]